MKTLLGILLFTTLTYSAHAQARRIGGIHLFTRMTIICKFPDHKSMRLEAKAYSRHFNSDPIFADVTIAKGQQEQTYRMSYVAREGLSLFFEFENREEGTALRVYTDDVGRMSSLKLGRKDYELTCMPGQHHLHQE